MPKKEKLKMFDADDEDRISKLPDDLIGNILSRLLTSIAVATCILSKDWKDKWLCIYKIDINLYEYNYLSEETLPSFVNRLEIHFRSFIGDFSDNLAVLTSLIHGFLKYKSEILHIEGDEREIAVPGRLLSRETLRKLVLRYSVFKVPTENCFPHLKTLQLYGLEVSIGEHGTSNEIDNTMTLKFTCPVLETLKIRHCVFTQVKLVEIYSPSLQRIDSETSYECIEVGDFEIKIFGATGPVIYESYGQYLDNIVFSESNATIHGGYDVDEDDDVLYETGIIVKNLLVEFLSTLVDLKLSY